MAKSTHKDSGNGRLGCVMVVEDDVILALSIEAALRDAGAEEVIICASTSCAMQTLDKTSPDTVILDVHLTDSDDGWALAELISLLGPRKPRIVFSTGSPEDIPPGIADMGPVFAKPYDPALLVDALSDNSPGGLFSRLRHAIG